MKFNTIKRSPNRAANDEISVYEILDAGFMCHIAFTHEGQAMMIPTTYGRKDDHIFIHGSAKNFMLNQAINGQTICIAVTHLDGLVLARTLFDTSANYRSVMLFGKAKLVEDEKEKLEGLRIITENIIKGRFDEVPLGSENELKATIVVKFTIESASAKIRSGGPAGDEDKQNIIWSGHIPLTLKAGEPILDPKFNVHTEVTESVKTFHKKHQ